MTACTPGTKKEKEQNMKQGHKDVLMTIFVLIIIVGGITLVEAAHFAGKH